MPRARCLLPLHADGPLLSRVLVCVKQSRLQKGKEMSALLLVQYLDLATLGQALLWYFSALLRNCARTAKVLRRILVLSKRQWCGGALTASISLDCPCLWRAIGVGPSFRCRSYKQDRYPTTPQTAMSTSRGMSDCIYCLCSFQGDITMGASQYLKSIFRISNLSRKSGYLIGGELSTPKSGA